MDLRALLPLLHPYMDMSSYQHMPELSIASPVGAIPLIAARIAQDQNALLLKDAVPADADSRSGHGHPITVVVTPSGHDAEELADILRTLIEPSAVDIFPSWETLPHERLSPRSDTVARRLRVLRKLAHREEFAPLAVLIVPVRALLQPIAAGLGDISPIHLHLGDSVDFTQLQKDLVCAAYTRVDMVESRGEFAVRGGIIDVFPPTDKHPLRIEFFGDEVETIRTFAVADQRSIAQCEEIYAPACREILLTADVRERAAQAVEQFPGAADMLTQLSQGIAVEGMESLAPILVEKMHPLSDEFPSRSRILLAEPERIAARAESLLATSDEFLAAAWSAAAAGARVPIMVEEASFLTLERARAAAVKSGHTWWRCGGFTGAQAGASNEISDDESAEHEHGAENSPVQLQLNMSQPQEFAGNMDRAFRWIADRVRDQWRIVVITQGAGLARRLSDQLGSADIASVFCQSLPDQMKRAVVYVLPAPMREGFVLEKAKLAVLIGEDMVSRRHRNAGGHRGRGTSAMPKRRKNAVDPLQLKPGDYVVHERHGVGQFVKLAHRSLGGPNGAQREYVVIDYAARKRGAPRDQLWVPTDQLDQVSKYMGGDAPTLNKMGGSDWAKTKAQARTAVRQIAKELIRLYARRRATRGFAFSPDTPWQRELEDAFEYVETPDQLSTIDEVKKDMESPEPMDRLISGDVGYGKTEIAVRAAFKAVQDAKQVAVLAPTTLLVQQHLETFRDRYAGFPVRVEGLSRFHNKSEAEKVIAGLKNGSVDIVIGTHKLLTGDVRFKDLGLVIIDEEQRFGVEHKEALKQLYPAVDVLSMSATPIPRTLEMAVTGLRQMSQLATAPEERHPILTYVGVWQEKQISAAIKRELLREGQVFFIHNRTESIYERAAMLSQLVPDARVGVAHGKMSEAELEGVINDFWNKEIDLLVCTTIVETGLDIANANTLIVENAQRFGLSQLHQLRGRVGRGRERAYAYFLYPAGAVLNQTAVERLRTIASRTELGAGTQVALKDLEIRGAGNLLGGQQSGHIAGVGFDLYVRMVAEAVEELTGAKKRRAEHIRAANNENFTAERDGNPSEVLNSDGLILKPGVNQAGVPTNLAAQEYVDVGQVCIELPVDAFVPQEWVNSERLRLEIYTKISASRGARMRSDIRNELMDRYGTIPAEVDRLFRLAALREQAALCGIQEITIQGKNVRFSPVQLPDSRQVRLKRLYPRAVTKAALRSVIVPVPTSTRNNGIKLGSSAKPVSNEAIFDWVEEFLQTIFE